MLMQIVNTILARWQLSLGILAALVMSHSLTWCHGDSNGYDRRDKEQVALERKALEKARKADQVAAETVTKGQDNVEAGNQRAREAGGDDPLGNGLRSLRTETRSSAATR